MDEHKYITMYCENCGDFKSVRLNCGKRLCPECRKGNYFRLMALYVPIIARVPKRRLTQMTLTYKNRSYLSSAYVRAFKRDLAKIRKTKFFRSSVRGGLQVVECNHKSDNSGWNLHCHFLLDARFVSVRELSREWFKITGHSYIVDVRREDNSRHAVSHLLKYFYKVPKIQGRDIEELKRQYESSFCGSRNVVSFGTMFNSASDEFSPYRPICPSCGHLGWINEFELFSLEQRSVEIFCPNPG